MAGDAEQRALARAMDAAPLTPLHCFMISVICSGHLFEVIELMMTCVFALIFAPAL